jgi:dTDP-4-dehydrorhamnose 3,5-epimerase
LTAGNATDGWRRAGLEGVWRRSLTFHPDDRGSFAEIWRGTWGEDVPDLRGGAPVRQANLSRSAARVLRGLHVHRRQADVWVVLEGRALIGLVDIRPALTGDGAVLTETVDATAGDMLYLPEGVAHGFYARDPITLLYFVTNEYDGSDELGFAWDDPVAAVPWPDRTPILSPRDSTAPPLADLLAHLRGDDQQSVSR